MSRRLAPPPLLALALLAGCGGPELEPESRASTRAAELTTGAPEPGDFWQAHLAPYLVGVRVDGRTYRETPPEERFAAFGRLLLEASLREDQIAPAREDLVSDEDYETYCARPTYDDALHFLRWTLGVKPTR